MNESTGMVFQKLSQSPAQTTALGRALGRVAEAGDVIGLIGPLGAGKTLLVRGMAEGLDADTRLVASPTFVMVCEYEGRLPLVHIDAYRLEGLSDLESVGWSAELLEGAVTVIEWADRIIDSMPADRLTIELEHRGEREREIFIRPAGGWIDRIDCLLEQFNR